MPFKIKVIAYAGLVFPAALYVDILNGNDISGWFWVSALLWAFYFLDHIVPWLLLGKLANKLEASVDLATSKNGLKQLDRGFRQKLLDQLLDIEIEEADKAVKKSKDKLAKYESRRSNKQATGKGAKES